MGLAMIKPFKIIEVRTEADGSLGVRYEVWKISSESATRSTEHRMQAYMTVPDNRNVDDYLFEQLSKAGWF